MCHGRVSPIDVSYTDGGLSAPGRLTPLASPRELLPLQHALRVSYETVNDMSTVGTTCEPSYTILGDRRPLTLSRHESL